MGNEETDGRDGRTPATGEGSLRVGSDAEASGKYAVAVGEGSKATGNQATAVGQGSEATADNATALGQGSKASGTNTTAVGQGSKASGTNTTVVGQGAQATAENSMAIGQNAQAIAQGSVALGQGSIANEANTVSVGSIGNERRITNVAPGVNATDAVNVGQLRNIEANINSRINSVDTNARAGIASAGAMANLGQVYIPGKSAFSVAGAQYRGQAAYAVGYSRVSDDGKIMIRLSGSSNTQKDTMVGGGVTYLW